MRRALHIGIFIGIVIGMSACAAADPDARGAYGGVEIGRNR